MNSPWLGIAAGIIGVTIIASIVANFQRVTTNIEDKYRNKTPAEIDALYYHHFSANTPWTGGVTNPTGVPAINVGSDPDHDGLTTTQEKALGTDPRNPDTDWDFVSDGLDPYPLDPQKGGALPKVILLPLPEILPETKELLINVFYKNAKNPLQTDAKWSHYTDAAVGDKLSFLIYAELTNTSTDLTFTPTAQLTDKLSQEFTYVTNSGYIRFNNSEPQPLPDEWITREYLISIPPNLNPQKPVPIEITFDAILNAVPTNQIRLTNNQATLKTPTAEESDTAVITIK